MIPISIYKSKVENTGPKWSGPVVQDSGKKIIPFAKKDT